MIGSTFKSHVHCLSTPHRDGMMAGLKLWRIFVSVVFSLYIVSVSGADDILVGCGGFVKSDVEIDYSLVEVS